MIEHESGPKPGRRHLATCRSADAKVDCRTKAHSEFMHKTVKGPLASSKAVSKAPGCTQVDHGSRVRIITAHGTPVGADGRAASAARFRRQLQWLARRPRKIMGLQLVARLRACAGWHLRSTQCGVLDRVRPLTPRREERAVILPGRNLPHQPCAG